MTNHKYVVHSLGVTFGCLTCPKCGEYIEQDGAELEYVDDGVIGYGGPWRCGCGATGTYSFFAELKDVTIMNEDGEEEYVAVQTPYTEEE